MRFIIAIAAACLLAGAAYADAPFIYTRTTLKIVPQAAPAAAAKSSEQKEKKDEGNKPTEILPHLPRVAKEFTVDVRTPQFLEQRDFISLQPFTDKEGMLVLIDPPQVTLLRSTNMLAKADVLFLMEDGLISKIAPELSLHNMAEPIDSEKPVRAFLFLKAGMAKASDIRPGDTVENALFKTHPVVIDAPVELKPATSEPQK